MFRTIVNVLNISIYSATCLYAMPPFLRPYSLVWSMGICKVSQCPKKVPT